MFEQSHYVNIFRRMYNLIKKTWKPHEQRTSKEGTKGAEGDQRIIDEFMIWS